MENNSFGKWLKNYLEKHDYKIENFAEEVGYSFGLISHYTRGRRSPSYKFIKTMFEKINFTENEKKEILDCLRNDKLPFELQEFIPKQVTPVADSRVDALDKRSLSQYEKTMEEATLFFNDENITEEDKQKLLLAMNEMFFISKQINKEKYSKKSNKDKK